MGERARGVARPGEPPNQQARDRERSGQHAGPQPSETANRHDAAPPHDAAQPDKPARRPPHTTGGPLTLDRATTSAIAALCREYGVARLDLFGSATTDRFDPERSDVDFLLEFLPKTRASFKTYFALKTALAELLGRKVDLVMDEALENPYFAAMAEQSRRELYAA